MTSPTNPFHSIGARIVVSSGKSENVAIQILDSEVKLGCNVTMEGTGKTLTIKGDANSGIDVSKAEIGTATISTGIINNLTTNKIKALDSGLYIYPEQLCLEDGSLPSSASLALKDLSKIIIDKNGFGIFPNTLLGWYYIYAHGTDDYSTYHSDNIAVTITTQTNYTRAQISWNSKQKCKIPEGIRTYFFYHNNDNLKIDGFSGITRNYLRSDYKQIFAFVLSTGSF